MPDVRIKDIAVESEAPAPDDFAETDGAVNGGRKFRLNRVNEWMANRAMAPHFWSDGATTNRALVQTPGARGNLAGAPVAAWVGWVDVPAANPPALTWVCGPSADTTGAAFNFRHAVYILTNGTLRIEANGAAGGVDFRRFDHTTFRANYSGQRVWLEVRFTKGVANPVVRINGADTSGIFSASTGGTPPEWLDSTMGAIHLLSGLNWPLGIAPLGCWLNAHLTDAESESWRITGRPPKWVADGGSQINQIADASRNADFSAGATDWTNELGNQTNIIVSSGQLTVNGGNNWAGPRASDLIGGLASPMYSAGRRCRVAFDFVSGAATSFQVYLGSAAQGSAVAASTGQRVVLEWTNDRNDAPARVRANGSYTIDNVAFQLLGALSLLRPQAINYADDWTMIGGNGARLVGMQGITEDRRWRAVGVTSTNGNQQLFGGDVFDSTRDVIEFMEQAPRSGTPTTSIGSASGGAQYKASAALTAGINALTPVTRKLATNAVWVASNSTDEVVTTITGHRAGA